MALTFGSQFDFGAASGTKDLAITWLDSTHVIVCYKDESNSNHGVAKLGIITDTDISWGSGYEFQSADGIGSNFFIDNINYRTGISVEALDSSRFVICWVDVSAGNNGQSVVGTVSGTTISYGSTVNFLAARPEHNDLVKIDTDKVVVSYRGPGNVDNIGQCKVGTITGDSISWGTAASMPVTGVLGHYFTSLAKIDSSTFAVAYRDGNESSHGKCIAGTVSGTTITYGNESIFSADDGGLYGINVGLLDSTHLIVTYQGEDVFNMERGYSQIGTISGTDISWGSQFAFNSGTIPRYAWSDIIDGTHFVVLYSDVGDSNHGTAKVGTVAGSDITYDMETEFLAVDGSMGNQVKVFDSTKFIIGYVDTNDSSKGSAQIGTLSFGTQITASGDLFIDAFDSISNDIGTFVHGLELFNDVSDLFIHGHIFMSGNLSLSNLYIPGQVETDRLELFVKNCEPITDSIGLFNNGHIVLISGIDSFIHGLNTTNNSIDLVIVGPLQITNNAYLYVRGTVSGLPPLETGDDDFGLSLEQLFKNGDYNPQIIGRFTTDPDSVTIEIWDIMDGANTLLVLSSNDCYQISDTGRWAFSTINLPQLPNIINQYVYRMTGDTTETFDGKFILRAQKENTNKIPRNNNHIKKV